MAGFLAKGKIHHKLADFNWLELNFDVITKQPVFWHLT